MITVAQQTSNENTAVRPFQRLAVPEGELTDLRERVKATRWPTRELVTDDSQGVQLATIQALANYWADGYDWRKIEARVNATPQFLTQIDGVDIWLNRPPQKAEKRRLFFGGDAGTRTPDPLHAKQVLYQLSYIPKGDVEDCTRHGRHLSKE